eukprot:190090-Prorocentrum_minimum.AAC.1
MGGRPSGRTEGRAVCRYRGCPVGCGPSAVGREGHAQTQGVARVVAHRVVDGEVGRNPWAKRAEETEAEQQAVVKATHRGQVEPGVQDAHQLGSGVWLLPLRDSLQPPPGGPEKSPYQLRAAGVGEGEL